MRYYLWSVPRSVRLGLTRMIFRPFVELGSPTILNRMSSVTVDFYQVAYFRTFKGVLLLLSLRNARRVRSFTHPATFVLERIRKMCPIFWISLVVFDWEVSVLPRSRPTERDRLSFFLSSGQSCVGGRSVWVSLSLISSVGRRFFLSRYAQMEEEVD